MKTTKWIVSSSLMAVSIFAWAGTASSPVAEPAMAPGMQQMHAQMPHKIAPCSQRMKSNTTMHSSTSAAH